ncbi:MAG: NADH-quinone oxidoreductase subunit L [Gemmatimonadaceae bacterium]
MPITDLLSLFRFDRLTLVMLLLVTGLGIAILRFSRRYLDRQPGVAQYRRWLLATLAATTVLVSAGNLLLLAAAWTTSSLCLHRLLTFFPNRREAQIAAHKKFILARASDLLIWAGVVCIGRALGTFNIGELLSRVPAAGDANSMLQAGGFLLAAGVVVRSALLPFHGWLIQVMEAPTPVSALLHAGVVNIGGFVMLRLAPLMAHLEPAQGLLVFFGATSAVVASLVMMTRVSIKVSLAWSTCAQMGFMLLECGLGAYSLALMHLIAHSIYKAHAFLSSGGRVTQQIERRTVWAINSEGSARVFGITFAVVAIFVLWHQRIVILEPVHSWPLPMDWRIVYATFLFVILWIIQTVVLTWPSGMLSRRLYPHLLAGAYLDEVVTRATFALWPLRDAQRSSIAAHASEAAGVNAVPQRAA